jgi:GAF domain-containing protein
MPSSSEAVRVVELFGPHAQEGPCLDCYQTGLPVLSHDLDAVNDRWPLFAVAALAAGFHSGHALPMRLRGNIIGAANLFNTDQRRNETSRRRRGQAVADIATIAILRHRDAVEGQLLNEQLRIALDSRVVIEQAKRHGGRAVGRRHGTGVHHAA